MPVYQSSVYSTVLHRHSTNPPTVPVLRILNSQLQAQYQSSLYSTGPHRQVPVLRLLYNTTRRRSSPPYTLQSKTFIVQVLRKPYSQQEKQNQSSVYSTVLQRPSISPSYTPQAYREIVPVYRIFYISPQTQFQPCVCSTPQYLSSRYSTVIHWRTRPPYTPDLHRHSTSPPSQPETHYQYSVYSTVIQLHSTSPQYTMQSTRGTATGSSTVYQRQSTSPPYTLLSTRDIVRPPYTLKSITDTVWVLHILFSRL